LHGASTPSPLTINFYGGLHVVTIDIPGFLRGTNTPLIFLGMTSYDMPFFVIDVLDPDGTFSFDNLTFTHAPPLLSTPLPGCGPSGGRPPKCDASAVPIPAALPLFASGLGGLAVFGFWRRRKQAA
jgi:hypothetical protein